MEHVAQAYIFWLVRVMSLRKQTLYISAHMHCDHKLTRKHFSLERQYGPKCLGESWNSHES